MLFADHGLSDAEISALFVIWSGVGILAEVPSGALADRFSRRGALVVSSALQAAGYAVWILAPGFAGFATGFVLWALGGALMSGAFEALLFDDLVAVKAGALFPRIYGWTTAMGLIGQLPAAAGAVVFFQIGGYELVGWVSVGCCLAASAVAALLPESRQPHLDAHVDDPFEEPAMAGAPTGGPDPADLALPPGTGRGPDLDGDAAVQAGSGPDSVGPQNTDSDDAAGYRATLRAGLVEAATHPGVRAALLGAAMLAGLDAFEEYTTLLAQDWGVATAMVPIAALGIPVAGAIGAWLGGRAARLSAGTLAVLFTVGVLVLAVSGILASAWSLAGVALFYGIYRTVLVVAESRLQQSITGSARATVTSVSGVAGELAAIAVFIGWAIGGLPLIIALMLLLAPALARWLRPHPGSRSGGARTSRAPLAGDRTASPAPLAGDRTFRKRAFGWTWLPWRRGGDRGDG